MDLSAAKCKGGLGAVATEINGFGVAWGIEFLRGQLDRQG
jgi:leucyl aminopeptidase